MCINLDRAADLLLNTDSAPPSEDFLDMAENEGQGRIDYEEWEGHALERTTWDADRSAAAPDDWESTTPFLTIVPEERDHKGMTLPFEVV